MILFALNDLTWITIVNIICGTVITVVGLIVKRSVDKNTEVTVKKADEILGEAAEAKTQAKQARAVGIETLKGVRKAAEKAEVAAQKAEVVEEQVKELQEDSALRRQKEHIRGDERGGEK